MYEYELVPLPRVQAQYAVHILLEFKKSSTCVLPSKLDRYGNLDHTGKNERIQDYVGNVGASLENTGFFRS